MQRDIPIGVSQDLQEQAGAAYRLDQLHRLVLIRARVLSNVEAL
jgi:hypothetical protein